MSNTSWMDLIFGFLGGYIATGWYYETQLRLRPTSPGVTLAAWLLSPIFVLMALAGSAFQALTSPLPPEQRYTDHS